MTTFFFSLVGKLLEAKTYATHNERQGHILSSLPVAVTRLDIFLQVRWLQTNRYLSCQTPDYKMQTKKRESLKMQTVSPCLEEITILGEGLWESREETGSLKIHSNVWFCKFLLNCVGWRVVSVCYLCHVSSRPRGWVQLRLVSSLEKGPKKKVRKCRWLALRQGLSWWGEMHIFTVWGKRKWLWIHPYTRQCYLLLAWIWISNVYVSLR